MILLSGCTFGNAKRGKTSSMLAAFPNGIYVGDVAKTKMTAQVEYGFEPLTWPVDEDVLGYQIPESYTVGRVAYDIRKEVTELDTLIAVERFLGECLVADRQQGIEPAFDALCVDDVRLLALGSLTSWEDSGVHITNKGNEDMRTLYRMLGGRLARMTVAAREIRLNFWSTTHEVEPGMADGKKIWGGPDFGSSGQVQKVPQWLYTIVRAVLDDKWPDPDGFPSSAWCDNTNPNWVTNDSMGVFGPKSPLNIREVARASAIGLKLSRFPGLDWQEDLAGWTATKLKPIQTITKSVTAGLAAEAINEAVKQGYTDASVPGSDRHIRWAFQDGLAREMIWRQANSPFRF